MSKTKTLFFGSGKFALLIFQSLVTIEELNVTAIVTQPDKPAGRKQELTPSPLKEYLLKQKNDITIYQPEELKLEAENILSNEKPELIVVADYGQILPVSIIDYPKYKCINIHGSIVPELRGAAPIQMAIYNGLEKTGISLLQMTPGLDDGPVLAIKEYKMKGDETGFSLTEILAGIADELLKEILPKWLKGEVKTTNQDETKVTFSTRDDLTKEKAQIQADTLLEKAERMIRAFNPNPYSWVKIILNDQVKRLQIIRAHIYDQAQTKQIGLFYKHEGLLLLQLKNGNLALDEIKLEGKQLGSGKNYFYLADQKALIYE